MVSLGDRQRRGQGRVVSLAASGAAKKRSSAPGVVSTQQNRDALELDLPPAAAQTASAAENARLSVLAGAIAGCAAKCAADDAEEAANSAALATLEAQVLLRRVASPAGRGGAAWSGFSSCIPTAVWSFLGNDIDDHPARRILDSELASEEIVDLPMPTKYASLMLSTETLQKLPEAPTRVGLLTPVKSPRAPSASGRVGVCGDPLDQRRWVRFAALLNAPRTDFHQLRRLSQSDGVPMGCRAEVWALLLQCLPLSRGKFYYYSYSYCYLKKRARTSSTLVSSSFLHTRVRATDSPPHTHARTTCVVHNTRRTDRRAASQVKRAQTYWSQVILLDLETPVVSEMMNPSLKNTESATTRQIAIDLVRLIPNLTFDPAECPPMTEATISAMFMRMLAVWSARHPAVGYVQGLDRLVVPFFRVHFFGAASLSDGVADDEAALEAEGEAAAAAGGGSSSMNWEAREAACYWCLEKLLEGLQDRFIHNQPAIQSLIFRFSKILAEADEELAEKLSDAGVTPWQYAVPWLSTLQTRDLPDHALLRFWDSCLADDNGDASGDYGFSAMHLHSIVQLVVMWRRELLALDEIELIQFLQTPPCRGWNEADVMEWLAQTSVLRDRLDRNGGASQYGEVMFCAAGASFPSSSSDGRGGGGRTSTTPSPGMMSRSGSPHASYKEKGGWWRSVMFGSTEQSEDSTRSSYGDT